MKKYFLFLAPLLFVAVYSCGYIDDLKKEEPVENTPSGRKTPNQINSQREAVYVPIQVNEKSASFNLLANATAYTVNLEDCSSGYTDTVTEVDGSVLVYIGDTDCLGKLTTFTFDSKVFTPKTGSEFTNYAVNDSAVFEEVGGKEYIVYVDGQLASPVTGLSTVRYVFTEVVDAGLFTVATSSYAEAHSISVTGDEPPDFSITQVSISGLNASGGGEFTFEMTCNVAMSGTDCNGVDLSTIDYKLVEDTYSSTLATTDASTIFSTAGATISIPGDQHANNNGGFNTSLLTGPTTISSKPNMILILRSGASYQYFNVDVTLTNSL